MVKRYIVSEEPDLDESVFDLELGPIYQEGVPVVPAPAGPSKLVYSKLCHTGYKIVITDLFIFNGSAADELTPLIGAGTEFRVSAEVEIESGAAGSGTITIEGISGGNVVSDVLTFSGPGVLHSSYLWSSLTRITTSGLADEVPKPTVKIRALDYQGTPKEYESREALRIRFENRTTHFMKSPGSLERSNARAFTIDNTLKIGDWIEYQSIKYQIEYIIVRCNLAGIEAFRVVLFGFTAGA